MARVLLAWELGGNSGHVVRLAAIATRLRADGHQISLAVQRPDSLRRSRAAFEGCEIRQAPVWPGLLAGVATGASAATYGDILAMYGMADSGILEFLLRSWEQLLTDAAPDIVVCDFAPAALLATAGRVPRVAVGTGFTVPPVGARFPIFHPDRTVPNFDEQALLRAVNHALNRTGRAPLEALPDIARADVAMPAVFRELDPYGSLRSGPEVAPFLDGARVTAGVGDALAVYLPAGDLRGLAAEAVAALVAAAADRRVLAHMPGLPLDHLKTLSDAGVEVFDRPIPPAIIASTARLVLSTGGIGLTSTALAAGLPMAFIPGSVEQRLTALAVETLGSGRTVGGDGKRGMEIGSALAAVLSDTAPGNVARRRAPGFMARIGDPSVLLAQSITGFI
ncbi:MAG: glycosyltransferase [Devosia sp.]